VIIFIKIANKITALSDTVSAPCPSNAQTAAVRSQLARRTNTRAICTVALERGARTASRNLTDYAARRGR